MNETQQKYEDALRQIGWQANKFKMSGPEFEKEVKETLGVDDLWYIIEKIGSTAMEALKEVDQ